MYFGEEMNSLIMDCVRAVAYNRTYFCTDIKWHAEHKGNEKIRGTVQKIPPPGVRALRNPSLLFTLYCAWLSPGCVLLVLLL